MSEKVKTTSKKPKVHVAMVIDESGSMASIKKEIIDHYNEQVQEIKKSEDKFENRVSLVVFSGDAEIIYYDKPVDSLEELTEDTYRPGGATAMYDGVGIIVDKLRQDLESSEEDDYSVLVCVISDGKENNSSSFKAEDIAKKIKECQNSEKWTFVYIGANQDLTKVREVLNIPKSNMYAFAATAKGVRDTSTMSAKGFDGYYAARSAGKTQVMAFCAPEQEIDLDKASKIASLEE